MKTLSLLLKKSYPLEENKKKQFFLSLIFGVIIFFVLYIFQPFNNHVALVFYNLSVSSKVLYSLLGGLITTVVLFIDFLFFFFSFPKYFMEEKWTVGREIIWTLTIITTIATGNFLVNVIFWNIPISFFNWINMVVYTAIIGIVPATVSILLNQARLLKKFRTSAIEINKSIPQIEEINVKEHIEKPEKVTNQEFIIFAENGKDNVKLNTNNFIAATSADNYCKIYYLNDKSVLKNTIIRTTLKIIEEQVAPFTKIMRCHRTAIANIGFLNTLNGTAQGYKLQLKYGIEEIPVSRSLNKELKAKIAAL